MDEGGGMGDAGDLVTWLRWMGGSAGDFRFGQSADALEAMQAEIERLRALLKDALPHVEKMANVLATGPVAGPVEHLAGEIQTALTAYDEQTQLDEG